MVVSTIYHRHADNMQFLFQCKPRTDSSLLSSLFSFSLTFNYVIFFLFSEVRVEGLETLDYLDNLQNKQRFTEQGDAITFESEVSFVDQCCFSLHFVFVLAIILSSTY